MRSRDADYSTPEGDEIPDAPPSDAPAPAVLAGRFRLREVVGSGGMAIVYRAWDRAHRRSCAVKVLADVLSRDEQFRRRFRREAEAARGLTHPSIVNVYDWGDSGPHHYLVMEYVGKGTLRELLGRQGPLPETAAIRFAIEVADALAYAHARGVIHRDIKPQNILLTADGAVKVADFGIARTVDASGLTRTGAVMGSAHYLSPEQARGEPAGPRSDLYALGVVLFEMLAGRVPFDGDSAVAIALKHVGEPPPDLRQLRPDVSEPTAAVVARLLAKDEGDRYVSAAALAADLRQIASTFLPQRRHPGGGRVPIWREPGVPADTPNSAPTEQIAQSVAHTRTLPRVSDRGADSNRPATPRVDGETIVLPATGSTVVQNGTAQALPRRPAAAMRVIVVGVLLACAVAGAAWYGAERNVVFAPVLVGRTLAAASQDAQSRQLHVVVAGNRQDPRTMVGTILAQDPPPGRPLHRGSSLRVVISQGSGVVPDVRGLVVTAATSRLAAAGLRLGRTSYIYDWSWKPAAAGSVLYQFRPPGAHLAPNEPVDVLVSQGPPPSLFWRAPTVPPPQPPWKENPGDR